MFTTKRNDRLKNSSQYCGFRFVAFAVPLLTLSACGFLSNPARDETPSRLLLEAQTEYDAGRYSNAINLLEKLVEKDPSSEEGRVRLTFAYNGSIGITPIEFVKSFATSSSTPTSGSSNTSEIGKLTGKSSLPDTTLSRLKAKGGLITKVAELRSQFSEFATFQKAFLTLCPLFSKTTISSIKIKAASALEILELEKCGEGRDEVNPNTSVAALMLALGQFSSLYKAILDTDDDGTIDLQKKATDAKTQIEGVQTTDPTKVTQSLTTLSQATNVLTQVGTQLQGEVFRLAIAQFSIIDAVVSGTNFPDKVKDGITQGVTKLNEAVDKINSYLDAGKTTGGKTQTGATTAEAATKAKDKADSLLANITDQEKLKSYCKDFYCFNSVYKTSQTPEKCKSIKTDDFSCASTSPANLQ